jgi:hypothetical protein
MEIDAEILAHYAEGREHGRLTSGLSLELLRTQVLLERFLPAPPARVLDVGGASGVYASCDTVTPDRKGASDPSRGGTRLEG